MPESTLTVTVGVDPSEHARLRDELGRFMRANEAGRMYTQMQLGLAVSRFTRILREEFARHNRTDETIKTLHIQVLGLQGIVTMGRGAPFVYYGWARGPQTAKPGGVITFLDRDGIRVFTRSTKATFYVGDRFVDRAMERTDLTDLLLRIAHGVFHDITGYATYSTRDAFGRVTENQYTGGQQFRGDAAGIGTMIR